MKSAKIIILCLITIILILSLSSPGQEVKNQPVKFGETCSLSFTELLNKGLMSVQTLNTVFIDDSIGKAEFGTRTPFKAPPNFPVQKSWNPLRNYGPFYRGMDFDLVQIMLNGVTGIWYYNSYLTAPENKEIYKKYYGPQLPNNKPEKESVSGGYSVYSGFNSILLSLEQAAYSSRYGGTILLRFISSEDYNIEIRKDSLLWDIYNLEMDLYIAPKPQFFNPASPNYVQPLPACTYIEFVPEGVTCYKLENSGLRPISDIDNAALKTILEDYSRQIIIDQSGTESFAGHASKFMHGFIHLQFQDMLDSNRIVSSCRVSDGYMDFETRKGEPTVIVKLRIQNIYLNGWDGGKKEIFIETHVFHVYQGMAIADYPAIFQSSGPLDDGEGTRFFNIGTFSPDELSLLSQLVIYFRVIEKDPLIDDRYHHEGRFTLLLDKSSIRNHIDNGDFGVISTQVTSLIPLFIMDDTGGNFSFETQVEVYLK